MTGEDVRQVFEAILPEHEMERLCAQFGVIERQRKLHLGMLVRAMVIAAPRRAARTRATCCGLIWNLKSPG